MLNPAAEELQREVGGNDESIQKLPHSKLEKKGTKSKISDSSNSVLKKIKSPKLGKRLLPDAPGLKPDKTNLSKSSEDLLSGKDEDKSATIMSKYKYNSLPRKKNKEKSSKSGSTSTFYLDTELRVSKSPNFDRKDITSSNHSSQNNSPLTLRKKLSQVSLSGSSPDLKRDSAGKNDIINTNNLDKQTHIALYKFHARHKDEISFNDGDPIQVLKCFEDLWYEGINLLSGKQGVFPSRYVADILSTEMITCESPFIHLINFILKYFDFFQTLMGE